VVRKLQLWICDVKGVKCALKWLISTFWGEVSEVHETIATTPWTFRIIRATPYVREISISFFGVCGYNNLIKFNKANFVFADVDLLGLEVKPWLYSRVLSISSASKSTTILLRRSPELYVHYSVIYHRYIYHSLYLVILTTFIKASRWLGRERDNTSESEGSLRISPIV